MATGQTDRLAASIVQIQYGFWASLYVKTALDVIMPSLVSKILILTRVHGHLIAAWLAERNAGCSGICVI